VCSGHFASRYHSEREISAPFNRPEQRKRIPFRAKSLRLDRLFHRAAIGDSALDFATKHFRDHCASNSGVLISWMSILIFCPAPSPKFLPSFSQSRALRR